jgi:peptidoglycan/LPS O-acetylase OafA/YrhL
MSRAGERHTIVAGTSALSETGKTAKASRNRTFLMDVLRGLLASWVVLHHIVLAAGFDPDRYPWRLLAHHGQEAVLVFFILSGFAIAKSLQAWPQHWSSFLVARFWRIYPVYLIALAIGAAVCGLSASLGIGWFADLGRAGFEAWDPNEGSPRWLHVLLHLTQLHGVVPAAWLPHADTSLVAPAWSLSTEFQFYAIAPALSLLLLRRVAGVRPMLPALLLLAALVANVAIVPAVAPASLLRYLDLFVLGIAGAVLHTSNRRGKLLYCLLAVVVAAAGWYGGRIIVANAVLVWLLFWVASTVAPARMTETRIGAFGLFVGALSYPLYLIHYPLMRLSLIAARGLWPDDRAIFLAAWIPASILLSYVAAFLLHHFVELRGTRFGKQVAMRCEMRGRGLAVQPRSSWALLRRSRGTVR